MTGVMVKLKTNIPGQEMETKIELRHLVDNKWKLISNVRDTVIGLFEENNMFESDGFNSYSKQQIKNLVDAAKDGLKSSLLLVNRQADRYGTKTSVKIMPENNNIETIEWFITERVKLKQDFFILLIFKAPALDAYFDTTNLKDNKPSTPTLLQEKVYTQESKRKNGYA